jgi:hypothetical protein
VIKPRRAGPSLWVIRKLNGVSDMDQVETVYNLVESPVHHEEDMSRTSLQ